MIVELAVATRTAPSMWAGEDWRTIVTAAAILQRQAARR
jgi:hypothetical protein